MSRDVMLLLKRMERLELVVRRITQIETKPRLIIPGGGSGKIFFEVDSAEIAGASSPYNGKTILTVTVITEPCDQDIETAEVVDWSSCLANAEMLAALVGREGWAVKGRGRQSLASGAATGEKTPCHWILDGLCCPP